MPNPGPPASRTQWAAMLSAKTGYSYCLGPEMFRVDPADDVWRLFDTPEECEAWLLSHHHTEAPSAGQTIGPVQPVQMPPPQGLPAQGFIPLTVSGPGVPLLRQSATPTVPLGSPVPPEIAGNVAGLPQFMSGQLKSCGQVISDVQSAIAANIGVINASCRGAIASCISTVQQTIAPAVQGADQACLSTINAMVQPLIQQFQSAQGIAGLFNVFPTPPATGPATEQPLPYLNQPPPVPGSTGPGGVVIAPVTPGMPVSTLPFPVTTQPAPVSVVPTFPQPTQPIPTSPLQPQPISVPIGGQPALLSWTTVLRTAGGCFVGYYNTGPAIQANLYQEPTGAGFDLFHFTTANNPQFGIVPHGWEQYFGFTVPYVVDTNGHDVLAMLAAVDSLNQQLGFPPCTGPATQPPQPPPIGQPPQPPIGQPQPPIGQPPPPPPCPPCPTPPSEPVITEFNCGDVVPCVQPAVTKQSDYISSLVEITAALVNLGNAIVSGIEVDKSIVARLMCYVGNPGKESIDTVSSLINDLLGTTEYGCVARSFDSIVAAYPYCNYDQYKRLQAVKQVLECLVMAEAGGSVDSGLKSDETISIGFELFKLGAAHGWSWPNSLSDGAKASIHQYIAPLISLIDRCINGVCQTEIPGIPDAIEMLLANQITYPEARGIVEFNGGIWDVWAPIINSRRTRPDVLQSISLYFRGLLSLHDLNIRLRGLGVIDPDSQAELLELAKFIPGPGDIVRFMVRNVEDPAIVAGFGLDDEFDQKFQGATAQYAVSQGIDNEAMLRFWRAHWVVPSPGQLYTMLQRLRPDNVPAGTPPGDWIVSVDDVRRALGENDVLPFWRDRLVAVSYLPLQKRDLVRLYQTGGLDEGGVISALQDQGYSLERAFALLPAVVAQALKQIGSDTWIGKYVKGSVSGPTLIANLQAEGYSMSAAQMAQQRGDLLIAAETQAQCVAALEHRFLTGDIDATTLITDLVNAGQDPVQAQQTATRWSCKLATQSKQLAAGQLCPLFMSGLLSQGEMATRLYRLGYKDPDVSYIILDCLGKRILQQQKAAQALNAKLLAASKAQETLLAKAQAAIQKNINAEAKLQASQAKRADSLKKQMLEAAYKMAAARDDDVDTVADEMNAAAETLVRSHQSTYDAAALAVIEAARHYPKKSTQPLYPLAENAYFGVETLTPIALLDAEGS